MVSIRLVSVLVIVLFILSGVIPSSISSKTYSIDPPDDELDQYCTLKGRYAWGVPVGEMYAQSFKPLLNVLTRIELLICKEGNPYSLKLSIREELDSEDIVSTTIYGSDFTVGSYWVEIDFPDLNVTPYESYFIVWGPLMRSYRRNSFNWYESEGNCYFRGDPWYYHGNWNKKSNDFCFKTYGFNNNPPVKPHLPSGPIEGRTMQNYNYSTLSTDPDGDDIRYGWDWNGDDIIDQWTEYFPSDQRASASHVWNEQGNYTIKVKAKDEHGLESEWSDPLHVTMPKLKPYLSIFQERFPYIVNLFSSFL